MEPLREGSELATVYRLAAAAERRDGETHAHTLRVGRAAGVLAESIGLSEREVELIRLAAPLHDLGKLGVPDAILTKPGPLNGEEREQMRAHVEIGRQILEGSESEVLRLAAEIAFTHHEWWDGSGYPRGLEEEETPLAGRLTSVVDAFDAMTHGRPYKAAWPVGEALAELQLSAGRQFDPWLVEAFELLDHERLLGLEETAAPPVTVEHAAAAEPLPAESR
jgi:putative two-component system response regulator